MTKTGFKKGQTVRFCINNAFGAIKGKGTVKRLPPKDAIRGAARLLVVTAKGEEYKPYPSQCKAA